MAERVGLSIDRCQYNKIREYCEETGATKANVIRMAIGDFLINQRRRRGATETPKVVEIRKTQ